MIYNKLRRLKSIKTIVRFKLTCGNLPTLVMATFWFPGWRLLGTLTTYTCTKWGLCKDIESDLQNDTCKLDPSCVEVENAW